MFKDLFTIRPTALFFGLVFRNDRTQYPDEAKGYNYNRGTHWGDVGEYSIVTLICLALFELVMISGTGYFALSFMSNLGDASFSI